MLAGAQCLLNGAIVELFNLLPRYFCNDGLSELLIDGLPRGIAIDDNCAKFDAGQFLRNSDSVFGAFFLRCSESESESESESAQFFNCVRFGMGMGGLSRLDHQILTNFSPRKRADFRR